MSDWRRWDHTGVFTEAWHHARGFLDWLFPHARQPVRFFFEHEKQRGIRWAFGHYEISDVVLSLLRKNMQGFTVFVQPNPCIQRLKAVGKDWGGSETNVAYSHVILFDWDVVKRNLDMRRIQARMRDFGLDVHALIRSGNGQHGYIRLDRPYPVAAVKPIAQRLCRAFFSDPVHNANRLMRLPGSFNWKGATPVPCYVERLDDASISLDELGRRVNAAGIPSIHAPSVLLDDTTGVSDVPAALLHLPGPIQEAMVFGTLPARKKDRSSFDFEVCCALVRSGLSNTQIVDVYATTELGKVKAAEAGEKYLQRTITAARKKLADDASVLDDNLQKLVDNPETCWYVAQNGSIQHDDQKAYEMVRAEIDRLMREAEDELQASRSLALARYQ